MRDRDASFEETVSRSRVARIYCVAALASLCACSGDARRQIEEQASSEFDVSGTESPQFTRRLSSGTYLVEVREDGIDFDVQVDTDKSHKLLGDQVPRHGTMFAVVQLHDDGNLVVQLRSVDHKTKTGRAHLNLWRWKHAAGEAPLELERGFSAFDEAGQQTALGNPQGWSRAADKLYEAVTHFTAAHDVAARAQAAYSLASLQFNVRDEWAAAVRATEIASESYTQLGDEVGVTNAATLRAAADINVAAAMDASSHGAEQKSLYASADRRLADAAAFFTAHGLPIRAVYAVNMRAVCAARIGDYASAEKFLEQAVAAARVNKDVAEEARSLGNLASINYMRGYMAEAARQYAALLPIVDHGTYLYATLLGNYGSALMVLGDFDQALRLQLEALALYTKMGEEAERATALTTLGGLYLRMGDANRSLETSRAAIAAQKRVSNIDGLSSSLRLAAGAASTLGDHSTALDYLRESARIDRNPHRVALTSVLIATQLRTLGRVDEAEDALSDPLQSANALARACAIEERAQLRLVRHDNKGAIEDLRSADQQYVSLGLDYNRIETNTMLSRALLSAGDVAGASNAVDKAIEIVGQIRVKSGNPEWRARFLSNRYAPFEARIEVDLAADPDATQAMWRAFRTAEGVRARSLADELAPGVRGRETGDGHDAPLRARLTSLQLELETRMQRQDADEGGTLALRRSIEETRAQLEANGVRNGGVAARAAALPASLQAVQHRLPSNTAVLAYFVGDQHAHGWLLTRSGLRHAAFDAGVQLDKKIDAALSARRGARDPAAERELANQLLGKLLDGVTEQRLLVIADGSLNGVPFAALPVPGSNGLLLDRFVLSYAPSLSLVINTAHPAREPATRVAVVSDPVYAPDDRRLRLAGAGSGGVYRGPAPPQPESFTRLPYSAMEANAVATAMGNADTVQLSGFSATSDKVLELAPQKLQVLHFATHAVARRDEPEQSALFLSQYAANGSTLPENRLSVSDIQRSGLHADLVVLSGCATGDGGELRGEGVLGLTYGFLANGSGAVVAALWPIEDASTARFMSAFYQEYRKSGRAAVALRNAQLQTRDSASAAVWSGFVVRANEYP